MRQLALARVLVDDHSRLDEVARFVAHTEQRFLKVLPTVIKVCDLGMEMWRMGYVRALQADQDSYNTFYFHI